MEENQNPIRFEGYIQKNKFPSVGDTLIAEILTVREYGSDCKLLQFKNIDAFLPWQKSVLNRRRQRKFRIGQNVTVQVSTVGESGKSVMLSRSLLLADDIEKCRRRIEEEELIGSIAYRVSITKNINIYTIYENFCWKLDENYQSIGEGLADILDHPEKIDNYEFDKDIRNLILETIRLHFVKKREKYEKIISIKCGGEEGIDAIKNSLLEGLKIIPITFNPKCCILGSPKYSISIFSESKRSAEDILDIAAKKIQDTMNKFNGGSCEY